MDKKKGLYGKYKIEKTDGTPIDPNADYFILRLDTDPAARIAAAAYADAVEESNSELAEQLRARIEKCSTYEPDVIGLLRDMASGEIRIIYEAGDEGEGSDTVCHGRISSTLGYDDGPEDRAVWNAWSAAMAQDFIELQEHAEKWWSVPYVLTDAGKQELDRSGSR